MEDAELRGAFHSSAGVGGRIRISVADAATSRLLDDSRRVESGNFDLKVRPGGYRLIFDNRQSLVFPRSASAGDRKSIPLF
jgi:hypothetical protein